MKKINKLVLKYRAETNYYYLLDIDNNERSEFFNNKVDGVSIILEYLEASLISSLEGTDLIYKITEITTLPICKKNKGVQISDDIHYLNLICETFDDVYFDSLMETEKDLPKYMEFCNNYGVIFGKNFRSSKLENKVVARATIKNFFEEKKVDSLELQKILDEIENGEINEEGEFNTGNIIMN